jgi:hypothetical protein
MGPFLAHLSCYFWTANRPVYFVVFDGLSIDDQGHADIPNSRPFRTTGTPGFEPYDAANWTEYAIPSVIERSDPVQYPGVSTYDSAGIPSDVPPAAALWVTAFDQAGGAPAPSDVMIGSVVSPYDGTRLAAWPDAVTTTLPWGWGCNMRMFNMQML